MLLVDMEDHANIIELKDLLIGYRSSGRNDPVYTFPISCVVSSGEMVGVIGRNGIGKSTLLRTIARLQTQLGGKIFLNGTDSDLHSRKHLAAQISFVSTEHIQVQHLTALELIALGRFPYTGWLGKLTRNDMQVIHDAIDRVGISNLAGKSIHQLSDGERQKVMIARSLAQDTPVIILDEPTAFLDLPSRYEIIRLLHVLAVTQHKTILFSTHDLTIAMDEADKLWLMTDEGIAEGAPEDLLIQEVFRKLFLNSLIEFDHRSSGFKFRRKPGHPIKVDGERKYVLFTRKALERTGFHAVDDNSCRMVVTVVTENGEVSWKLNAGGDSNVFNSIYTLIQHLKTLSINQQKL
jgi:iron complex transport system ATP-binding protein